MLANLARHVVQVDQAAQARHQHHRQALLQLQRSKQTFRIGSLI